MSSDPASQLRLFLRLISAIAIAGIAAAAVWFVFAAVAESGSQLAAASATAAGLGAAWSAGFAAIRSRLKSIEAVSPSARHADLHATSTCPPTRARAAMS